jgi:glycosyltransferase involved in cell wall biosynthesis
MRKLLYVCEVDSGGIAEYAILQCEALQKTGISVSFLCKPTFPKERLEEGICVVEFLPVDPPPWLKGKLKTIWRMTIGLNRYSRQIRAEAKKGGFDYILFSFYKEYFAPFWVGPLLDLKKTGFVMGTIAHDPVRDFAIGPSWWHRYCVRKGFSYLNHVFVHDETPVDFGGKKPVGIRMHQIPHGPYEVAAPIIGREAMRKKMGFDSGLTTEDTETAEEEDKDLSHGGTANTERLGKEAGLRPGSRAGASESDSLTSKLADSPVSESLTRSANIPASIPATSHPLPATPAAPDVVFLAFGQIRDGKNLDLFLRAMTRLPENVKLLVAGKGDSGSSRPPEFYQNLAEELGVGDRCRWDIRRIPDKEVGDLFAACDAVLVTYNAKFRSASGVLNAAVSARKQVLASCGGGPLRAVVARYGLGVFVEPDDSEEILRGAKMLLDALPIPATRYPSRATQSPEWARYERENSWEQNAALVKSAFFENSTST